MWVEEENFMKLKWIERTFFLYLVSQNNNFFPSEYILSFFFWIDAITVFSGFSVRFRSMIMLLITIFDYWLQTDALKLSSICNKNGHSTIWKIHAHLVDPTIFSSLIHWFMFESSERQMSTEMSDAIVDTNTPNYWYFLQNRSTCNSERGNSKKWK